MSVTEEGEEGYIQLTFTAPPALFCLIAQKEQDCKVVVVATVSDEEPLQCPTAQQKTIPQILFQESSKYSQSEFCSTTITMETWNKITNITFVANQDMRIDGKSRSAITLTTVVGDISYEDTQQKLQVSEFSSSILYN